MSNYHRALVINTPMLRQDMGPSRRGLADRMRWRDLLLEIEAAFLIGLMAVGPMLWLVGQVRGWLAW